MTNVWGALWQVGDFLLKAAVNYAETQEGKREIQEIIDAFEGDDDPVETANPAETQDVLR